MNRDECRNNAQTIKKIRTCILVVGRSEIVFIFRVLNFLVYDSDWYPSVFSIKYTLGEIWLSAISIKNAFCISSSICLRTLHTNYDKILCCVKKWMFVFIYFTHKKYLKNNKILLRHFGLPFWTNCTTILLGQAYFLDLLHPNYDKNYVWSNSYCLSLLFYPSKILPERIGYFHKRISYR